MTREELESLTPEQAAHRMRSLKKSLEASATFQRGFRLLAELVLEAPDLANGLLKLIHQTAELLEPEGN